MLFAKLQMFMLLFFIYTQTDEKRLPNYLINNIMVEQEESYQRNLCQRDIIYLAEKFIHYPLIDKLSLTSVECNLLHLMQNNTEVVECTSNRSASIYLVHQLLFNKSTTIFLIAQTKHLARKELESLYFPLNHLGLSFTPEIEVKYTGCLKLSNDMCIRSFGINDEIPVVETKKVIVISYNLLEIPIQLQGKKHIRVMELLSN